MLEKSLLDMLEKEAESVDGSQYHRGRYDTIENILEEYTDMHSLSKEYIEMLISYNQGVVDVLKEILLEY